MAEPLKHHFAAHTVASLRADLERAGIDPGDFEARANDGLADLELMDRGRHVARALRTRLPPDPAAALDAIVAILGPESEAADLKGMAVFRYLPHVFLIGELGADEPEAGLVACYEVTKRFTAEWCVRPIAQRHPERVLTELRRWTGDPNVHVRRLVSEGTRPRLPWAPRLDLGFDKTLPLLEALRDDPEEYVRRSVANHLNDVAKDHPEWLVDVAEAWVKGAPAPRLKLLRHALRTLVKRGHPRALAVLGFGGAAVRVENFAIPARATMGGVVEYTFDVVAEGDVPQRLVVDAVVGFRKARGEVAPKVFKVATVELGPGERASLRGRVRLHEMTTRKHYPGRHTVDVQVNGARHAGGAFELLPKS